MKTIEGLLKQLSEDCKEFRNDRGRNPVKIVINSEVYSPALSMPFKVVMGMYGINCMFTPMESKVHYMIG